MFYVQFMFFLFIQKARFKRVAFPSKKHSLLGCWGLSKLGDDKLHFVSRFFVGWKSSVGGKNILKINNTVRPQDTRPQAARTLQVHVFELGPKKFELNEFM